LPLHTRCHRSKLKATPSASSPLGIPRWGGHLTQAGRPRKESVHHGRFSRRWSPEFKRDAVALVRSSGRPISDIAPELGCGESSLGLLVDERPSVAGGGGS
jgi:Transposase